MNRAVSGRDAAAITVNIENSVFVHEDQAVAEVKITCTTADGLPVQQDYKVNWSTSAGKADASDFTPHSGTVTFGAGTHVPISVTIYIPLTSDSAYEGDETFLVTLSDPSPGLEIGNGTAIVTILNDDSPKCGAMGGNYCSQTGRMPRRV